MSRVLFIVFLFLLNPFSTASGQSYRGMCVLSNKLVWVSGSKGSVLRTSNGGKSWDTLNPVGFRHKDFRDIHAWSKKEAIIMSSGDSAVFLKTRNGGKTWYPVYINYRKGVFFDDMDFLGDKGMAISDPFTWHKALPKEPAFLFVETNDRGENWYTPDWLEKHPLLPADSTESMFAASGSILKLYSEGLRFATGGNRPRLLNISFKYPGLVHAVYLPLKSGQGCGIYSFTEDDMGNIIATGGCWNQPESADSTGAVWDGMQKDGAACTSMPGGYRSSVCQGMNGKIAVTTGTNGTDISSDRGKTWQQLLPKGFNVCRTSKSYVWLAGRATDGIVRIPLKQIRILPVQTPSVPTR